MPLPEGATPRLQTGRRTGFKPAGRSYVGAMPTAGSVTRLLTGRRTGFKPVARLGWVVGCETPPEVSRRPVPTAHLSANGWCVPTGNLQLIRADGTLVVGDNPACTSPGLRRGSHIQPEPPDGSDFANR
jgi:hypothetical protein